MEDSNRNILTSFDPHDDADRLIGHGSMEALLPIPPAATPAHTYIDVWAAPLEHADTPIVAEQRGDAADPTAVVEEDALTDEPTPDQAQAEAEVLCAIRDDDFWYWNLKISKYFPGYRPTDDEDIKRCIREIRERAASRYRAPTKTRKKSAA
jgi:hypothetical protein